jgi:hypothetical protein
VNNCLNRPGRIEDIPDHPANMVFLKLPSHLSGQVHLESVKDLLLDSGQVNFNQRDLLRARHHSILSGTVNPGGSAQGHFSGLQAEHLTLEPPGHGAAKVEDASLGAQNRFLSPLPQNSRRRLPRLRVLQEHGFEFSIHGAKESKSRQFIHTGPPTAETT